MSQIKRLRKKAGFTQTALARKLGVSEPTVRKWEDGTRTPRVKRLKRIAKVLGCSVEQLLAPARNRRLGPC